ncbi:hypothetical protein ACJX0J_008178, partial [Zea mays]
VDFWMADETGPCGPCIGFFHDCSDNNDGVDSVRNITNAKLVEICRLVFVEFDRQADGVLEPFQAKHVLTRINLECLAAILQKKESHYDLDVYAYVIRQVYSRTGKGFKDYTGKVGAVDTNGVDTTYRLVADHMRMIASVMFLLVTNVNIITTSMYGFEQSDQSDCWMTYYMNTFFGWEMKRITTCKNNHFYLNLFPCLQYESFLFVFPPEVPCQEHLETTYACYLAKNCMLGYLWLELLHSKMNRGNIGFKCEEVIISICIPLFETKIRYNIYYMHEFFSSLSALNIIYSFIHFLFLHAIFNKQVLGVIYNVYDVHFSALASAFLLTHVCYKQGETNTLANGDGVFVDCNFVPTDSKIQSVLGDISFEPHETVVSMEYLLGLVLALLGGSVKMQDYSDERKSQILDVVKSLAGGFDMDVIFTRTDGFTMTQEWLLLDCLDLNLRHGWIAARDLLTGPEVSFESLTLASNEPGFPHAEEIKNFLRGPQLTPIGLVSLQEDFVENVPCILFWNKHYHTIVMINGVLNSLVTDSNYLETRIVWQTLDGVNGDGVYLDNNFTPVYVGLDAATSVYGSYFVSETSTSGASTSFMKPNSKWITPHGVGLYSDCSLTQLCSGPDAALL